MNDFEVMVVAALRDIAGELGGMNERVKALEKRFDESPPTSSAPRRRKISAREATFGAGALVSAAIAILQALNPSHVPPPPPPRPAAVIEAPPK